MVTRVGGLATGMDIDGLVKSLMSAHRAPVDRLFQKRQVFEWQRDAYKEMNTKLTDFRNNKIFNFKLESNLNAKNAVVTGNTTAVKATAAPNALAGSLTIEVSKLATAASNYGTSPFGTTDFDPNKILADESAAGHLTGGTLASAYTFEINGVQIDVDPTKQSLNSVIANINSKTNVTAFFDSTTRQISFISKETGTVNHSDDKGTITFEEEVSDGHNFLSTFVSVSNDSLVEVAAQDAILNINGIPTTRTSNIFSVNGVEITLQEVNTGNPSTISIKVDTDKVVDSIKKFVADYNDILSTLNTKLIEPKYRDFPPLTVEQKSVMEEKDIELWNSKAMSGLLKNDSIIFEAVTKLRQSVSSRVADTGSSYNTLSSIGITTGLYHENGKLYVNDESKLREAVESDPEGVMALFTANGNDDSDQSDVGIAEKMYDALNKTLSDIRTKSGNFVTLNDGSFISNQINNMTKEITAKESRLLDTENNYYKRFTAMEMAIDKLNSQSASLAQMFGGQQ